MPRPRTPRAKAKATGRDLKNPARFEGRNEPKIDEGVGEPFEWLKPKAKQAWKDLADEIPWLNKSHRGLLSIAATIRGRMMGDSAEEVGVQAMNLYRQALGSMGATPSDASKVGAMQGDQKDEDDDFFDKK